MSVQDSQDREQRFEFQSDLPPEYCQYRDEGCELSGSCLRCPFPRCVHEEKGGERKWLKHLRAREMYRLYTEEDKNVKELAVMFGVSARTVQRIIKNVRDAIRSATRQQ